MIKVTALDDSAFEVTVESQRETRHRVTIDEADYQRLTGGKVSKEQLLKAAFEFLLEREPNTAILPTFDLMLISQYFSEFDSEMKQRLS